ncbi:hypothetical protein J6590_091550 [Homalodisca vitripennis]|nr:hypothetical protein J6590_091550 [Homalodisca vitripennis]
MTSYFSTVVNVGTECQIFDWRNEAYRVFKPINQWHFKFAPTKKFFLRKANKNKKEVVIKGEHFYYHEISAFRMLTRANKTIADIDPKLISPGLAGLVKKVKLADVKRLFEIHYGLNWIENANLHYYLSLIEKCTEEPERDLEPPEPECEGIEESPETIV